MQHEAPEMGNLQEDAEREREREREGGRETQNSTGDLTH